MTSDHQAISTMHTPLPNQQQVGAKGLNEACNDLDASSLQDGEQGQCVSAAYSNAQAGENGELLAAGMGDAQQFNSMNGAMVGDCDENYDQKDAVAMVNGMDDKAHPGDYYPAGSVSRQDSEVTTDDNTSGQSPADGANMHAVASEHLRVQVDQFSSSATSCPITDQSILPSPLDSNGIVDGEIVNGATIAIAGDNSVGPGGHWAPYEMSFEDLKTRVRHQLEYYFSRENLAADAYLRSQMDNDQFVRVTVLANFNMVKRLTTDMNLVLQALQESPFLQLDAACEKVRPIHKRCTLILREIPEETEKKEVEDLFASPGCPKIISCEYALNNIWYVNFENDEDAQRAFLYLRQQVQNFKGKPILARIKTAPIPRVQNGYRPVPPNTLPLQTTQHGASASAAPAATIVSPTVDASTPVPLPLTSSTFGTGAGVVGVVTPGDSAVGCANSVALPGTGAVAAMPPSTIYYYSTGGAQPTAIMTPGPGPVSAVVAAPAAAAVLSPSWAPASPPFDLGYILAVNGYQAQGAYRPALLVPAAPIPAHVAAAVGHRFVTDRPPRKPRTSGSYYYSSRSTGRSLSSNNDNGQTSVTPSYNRYGSSSFARPVGAATDGKPAYHRNDQNIHYNSIRNRPTRQGSVNGSTVNANGQAVRRYPPRTEHYPGADYWSSSTSSTKDRKAPVSSNVGASANANATEGKKTECFDLQSSSFPPLPTANAENGDDTAALEMPIVIASNSVQSSPRAEQHPKEQSAVACSSLFTAKPQLRESPGVETGQSKEKELNAVCSNIALNQSSASEEKSAIDATTPMEKKKTVDAASVTSVAPYENQQRDQIMVQKSVSTAAGSVIRGGTSMTIPVAVVVPNAQPKPQRVTTADKATVTDSLAHIPKKGSHEAKSSSVATMTTGPNSAQHGDGKTAEDKANDYAKRLSYAEMAKHAAARNQAVASGISATAAEKLTGGAEIVASSTIYEKDYRGNNEDGNRRWGPARGGTANGHAPQARSGNYQRESSNKYNVGRKQPKQYRKRDYPPQQEYGLQPQHALSPAPSSG